VSSSLGANRGESALSPRGLGRAGASPATSVSRNAKTQGTAATTRRTRKRYRWLRSTNRGVLFRSASERLAKIADARGDRSCCRDGRQRRTRGRCERRRRRRGREGPEARRHGERGGSSTTVLSPTSWALTNLVARFARAKIRSQKELSLVLCGSLDPHLRRRALQMHSAEGETRSSSSEIPCRAEQRRRGSRLPQSRMETPFVRNSRSEFRTSTRLGTKGLWKSLRALRASAPLDPLASASAASESCVARVDSIEGF
jgi:hypothetical protein